MQLHRFRETWRERRERFRGRDTGAGACRGRLDEESNGGERERDTRDELTSPAGGRRASRAAGLGRGRRLLLGRRRGGTGLVGRDAGGDGGVGSRRGGEARGAGRRGRGRGGGGTSSAGSAGLQSADAPADERGADRLGLLGLGRVAVGGGDLASALLLGVAARDSEDLASTKT